MKIEIDLSDVWADEEELGDAIQTEIIQQGVRQVSSSLEREFSDIAKTEIRRIVEAKFNEIIEAHVENMITSEATPFKYDSEMLSLEGYISKILRNVHGYNSIQSQMSAYAKKFTEDLRSRYDLAFASQIVVKMAEQGLLADDNLKKPLNTESK